MTSLKRFLPWVLWFLVTLFYIFQYVLRVSPSIMMPDILKKYSLHAYQFGVFSGAYYLGYALAHIPVGVLLDRLGPKKVISGSILLSILGLIPLILGQCWGCAVFGRFLVGAGSSGAILGVFNIIRFYFPEGWFSRLLGISVTLGLLGAIYGGKPVHDLIVMTSWERVLRFFILAGAFLAFFVFGLTPTTDKKVLTHPSLKKELKDVFTNKKVLLTAFYGALMVGVLEGFADVWAVSFFEVTYGFERSTASFLPSLIFLGMCVGALALPALAEKFNIYPQLVLGCGVIMGVLFLLILRVPLDLKMLQGAMVCLGIFSAYQILVIYLNILNAPPEYGNLVTAVTNMIIMSFGYVFHTTIGIVMSCTWNGTLKGCMPLYQRESYTYGLLVIPLTLFIAVIGFLSMGYLKGKKKL